MFKTFALKLTNPRNFFRKKKQIVNPLFVASQINTSEVKSRNNFQVLNVPSISTFGAPQNHIISPTEFNASSSIVSSDSSQLLDDFPYRRLATPVEELWKTSLHSKLTPLESIKNTIQSNSSPKASCRGCGQILHCDSKDTNTNSIESTLCPECERVFTPTTSEADIQLRFDYSANRIENNAVFETHFLNDFFMHQHFNGLPGKPNEEVYHLPLSPNYYYKKHSNESDQAEFSLCETQSIEDKVAHFRNCEGCKAFVRREKEILKAAFKESGGIYCDSGLKFGELFAFMVKNTKCMVSGLQGCWSEGGVEMFSLTIGYNVPPEQGGFSIIKNLKVCLDGLGDMYTDEHEKWVEALKKQQGYYTPK
ncbi:hypothetical protein [Parasitella parasitica]|uniref:Uncharacterized protein n=1 Tax=Parasitella parasitica TaxID=35722 RepID=A0A0B7N0Y3_9FUNG|nr:hypothetical protein [Parasitella parasitica]